MILIIEENPQVVENLFANITSIIALLISIVALIYTIMAYFLKSGHKMRGNYSIASSIECDDKYISSITLENLKDRATVVFKIYLKIGNNHFLELEDNSDNPLIIGAFEVYQKNYEPIIYYSINTNRIKLDKLFDNRKIKKQIILSTTDGKYKIKTNINRWNVNSNFFKNYMTAIIHPMRMNYNGVAYGLNVKYLLHFTWPNDKKTVIQLYGDDYRFAKYKKWELSKEVLENKNALENHLKKLKAIKTLEYKELEIIEHKKNCYEGYELDKIKVIEAKPSSLLQYLFLGRIYTFLENKRIKKINLNRNSKNKKAI